MGDGREKCYNPNPFSENIIHRLEKMFGQYVEFRLYSSAGLLLYTQTIQAENDQKFNQNIDLLELPQGLYHYEIKNEKYDYFGKVIKE